MCHLKFAVSGNCVSGITLVVACHQQALESWSTPSRWSIFGRGGTSGSHKREREGTSASGGGMRLRCAGIQRNRIRCCTRLIHSELGSSSRYGIGKGISCYQQSRRLIAAHGLCDDLVHHRTEGCNQEGDDKQEKGGSGIRNPRRGRIGHCRTPFQHRYAATTAESTRIGQINSAIPLVPSDELSVPTGVAVLLTHWAYQ